MKILICSGIYPPETGGPATYAEIMARELSLRGHKISVLTYTSNEVKGGGLFPIYSVFRSGPTLFRYLKYFSHVLWFGKGADILFALDTLSAGYPTYLANRILRKRMIVRVVGDHAWEQASRLKITDKNIDDFQHEQVHGRIRSMRKLQNRVVRGAYSIITPSNYLKNMINVWGVRPEQVVVIYNAVHIPAVTTRTEARRLKGIKKEFFVVSAGRDVPWKGFNVLKEAVGELSSHDVSLEILTSAPREELMRSLRAADVFVLNTSYEGFSHVLLEAMSLGIPVITTPVGGNVEVIKADINGIFIPVDDKEAIKREILRLKEDVTLRKELSKNAKETAQQFTHERMVNETEMVLTNI